jgi:hypothetical protein
VTPLDFVSGRRRPDLRAKPATIARATLRENFLVARDPAKKFQRVAKVPIKYGFS